MFESVIAGEVADDMKDKLRVDGGLREEEGGVQNNFAVPPYSSLRRVKKGEKLCCETTGGGRVSKDFVDVEKKCGMDCEVANRMDAWAGEMLTGEAEEENGEATESDEKL